MARITWGDVGSRLYEIGIDRGVLYVSGLPGVPWDGLTSLTRNATGGEGKPYYVDGEKYSNFSSREEYSATLTAYTYPDEFEVCDGSAEIRPGLFATNQKRTPFGLTYRTTTGSDVSDTLGYKIHLIYNVLASPTSHQHKSISATPSVDDFSWNLTAIPKAYSGYRSTAHFVLDSRSMDPLVLAAIEDLLYGSDTETAQLPDISVMTDLVDNGTVIVVTNNGDGTFSVKGPMSEVSMLDASIFQINSDSVTIIDANTWTASSP